LPRDNAARQRIVDLLATNGPITDKSGRATSVLKELVGYEQSDAGFSQLVSAMERDGQIAREIRGKRTFTITGTAPMTPKVAKLPTRGEGVVTEPLAESEGIDYDELAAALLARTAQVLASGQEPTDAAGWARRRMQQLEGRIDELERELARMKAEAKTFAITVEDEAGATAPTMPIVMMGTGE